jgi:ferredoxin
VIDSCVGCGLCGEVAHAAVLCPSFYRADVISNPGAWERVRALSRNAVIRFLQGSLQRLMKKAGTFPATDEHRLTRIDKNRFIGVHQCSSAALSIFSGLFHQPLQTAKQLGTLQPAKDTHR